MPYGRQPPKAWEKDHAVVEGFGHARLGRGAGNLHVGEDGGQRTARVMGNTAADPGQQRIIA